MRLRGTTGDALTRATAVTEERAAVLCSVIIPTIGRPTLERAVRSVLDQQFPAGRFEVVVVNDSGMPLPPTEWASAEPVRVLRTNRRERSFARNTGAAVARGRYLWFLDDDDWLLPGAFQSMRRLASESPHAAWLSGGLRVVDGAGRSLAEVHPRFEGDCSAEIVGGAWAPMLASMVEARTFFALGGFRADLLCTEDLDLCRRVAMHGEFRSTPETVACLLRGASWTTSSDYTRATRETQSSRDEVLSEPGAFSRLVRSVDSGFWAGRLVRVYLSTVGWNLRQRRVAAAISRMAFGTAGAVVFARYALGSDFWTALRAHHVPGSLHFVMEGIERKARQGSDGNP